MKNQRAKHEERINKRRQEALKRESIEGCRLIRGSVIEGRSLQRPYTRVRSDISEEHAVLLRRVHVEKTGEGELVPAARRNVRTRGVTRHERALRMSDQERDECTQEILRVFGRPKETRPPLSELLNVSMARRVAPFARKPPRDVNIRNFANAIRPRANERGVRVGSSLIINGRSQDRIVLQQSVNY